VLSRPHRRPPAGPGASWTKGVSQGAVGYPRLVSTLTPGSVGLPPDRTRGSGHPCGHNSPPAPSPHQEHPHRPLPFRASTNSDRSRSRHLRGVPKSPEPPRRTQSPRTSTSGYPQQPPDATNRRGVIPNNHQTRRITAGLSPGTTRCDEWCENRGRCISCDSSRLVVAGDNPAVIRRFWLVLWMAGLAGLPPVAGVAAVGPFGSDGAGDDQVAEGLEGRLGRGGGEVGEELAGVVGPAADVFLGCLQGSVGPEQGQGFCQPGVVGEV